MGAHLTDSEGRFDESSIGNIPVDVANHGFVSILDSQYNSKEPFTRNKVTFGHINIENKHEDKSVTLPEINNANQFNVTGNFNSTMNETTKEELREVFNAALIQQELKDPEHKASKNEMEELQNEMLLSQSIIKRREWTKKYRVADSVLYDLFSEFSSMVVLAKTWKQ